MELYIKIVNGQPVDHPIVGENFRQAYPHIDTNNLPADFARFVRVSRPVQERPYQVIGSQPTYQWADGVVTDVWEVRDMTAEERAELIASMMTLQPYPSWIFDEENCKWIAPAPMPEDASLEKRYYWDEPTVSWVTQPPVSEV